MPAPGETLVADLARRVQAVFSRPGPRIVDTLELLAGMLHPDIFPEWSPSARPREQVVLVNTGLDLADVVGGDRSPHRERAVHDDVLQRRLGGGDDHLSALLAHVHHGP